MSRKYLHWHILITLEIQVHDWGSDKNKTRSERHVLVVTLKIRRCLNAGKKLVSQLYGSS